MNWDGVNWPGAVPLALQGHLGDWMAKRLRDRPLQLLAHLADQPDNSNIKATGSMYSAANPDGVAVALPAEVQGADQQAIAHLAQGIGLKRVRSPQPVIYEWAIAPKLASALAPRLQIDPATLASRLALTLMQHLQQDPREDRRGEPSEEIGHDCTVTVRGRGLLQIEVGDRALTTWLYPLLRLPCPKSPSFEPLPPAAWAAALGDAAWFPIQVAHARCCSLISLGDREQCLALATPLEAQTAWPQIHQPDPIPGLERGQPLTLQHPAEWALFEQCLRSLDSWAAVETPESGKAALALHLALHKDGLHLSQQVQAFEAACRVLEPILLAHTQRRLGILLLAQRVLGLILAKAEKYAPARI